MVISTVDTGGEKTESAVVGFAEHENLQLIFGTSKLTRKYRNLQKNQNASFVIGWTGNIGTVQYEGVVKELSQEDSKQYSEMMIKKNPFSKKFAEDPNHRYFIVIPKWIRITDMSVQPMKIDEISL